MLYTFANSVMFCAWFISLLARRISQKLINPFQLNLEQIWAMSQEINDLSVCLFFQLYFLMNYCTLNGKNLAHVPHDCVF